MGIKKGKFKIIPMRMRIVIYFTISIFVTIGIIGYIVFSNWFTSTDEIIRKMSVDMNREIVNKIDLFIRIPESINEVNQLLLEKGIVDMEDEIERDAFFVNALDSQRDKGLYSFSYGTESGEYYGARRNKNNMIEIMRNNVDTGGHSWYYSVTEDLTAGERVIEAGKFDPRTRDWYKVAKEKKRLVFSPIYKHFVMDDLTVSAAVPIFNNNGKLQGVLSSHITLSKIDDYLKETVKDKMGYAVILEKESGELIANSLDMANFKTFEDGGYKRMTINEINNETIVQAYSNYMDGNVYGTGIDHREDRLNIALTEYCKEGLDWIIITAVPKSILAERVTDSIQLAVLLIIFALFLSVCIYLKLTKKFLEPIDRLIETTEKFSSGNLEERASISRNDEIGRIAKSFNKMAEIIYGLINNLEEKVKERTIELKNMNTVLKENKDQLQLILDSTAEGIYGIDVYGKCTLINYRGLEMLGYKDQNELIGKDMHLQIHHSHKSGTHIPIDKCRIYKALLDGKGAYANDEVFWRKDGTRFEVEYYSYPQYKDGEIVGVVVTFTDNTERKKMEQMIYNEKEQFKTTLLSVADGVISTDNNGKILVMNSVAEKLTGWTQEEAYGKSLEKVFHIIYESTREACNNPAKKVLETGEIFEMENQPILISKNEDQISIENSAAPIKDSDGNTTGVVIVFRDITEKKEKLMQIEYLSFHDHLTGLYNRRYLEDAMIWLDTQNNLPISVIVIDVNGLKLTNDAFGHEKGDLLLKSVADILKKVCRPEDIISRMGGDEFCILLPKTDRYQTESIKQRIVSAAASTKLDMVIVSIAVGYATKIEYDQDIKDIFKVADRNMYKEKLKHGKTMRTQTIETVLRKINLKYDQEQIHLERVSQYCEAIAIAMGLSDKEIQDIKTAGMLHDIGKIIVPPELLNKPGELTSEEFEVVKRHPEVSYQILKSVDEYASFIEGVLYHHERMDGTGYPKGLEGEKIPLSARIIAVADAFEAMMANRSYHKPKTKDEAIDELIKCSGTQFDPEIVRVFVEEVLEKNQDTI